MDTFGGWRRPYGVEPCPPRRPSDDDGLVGSFLCSGHGDDLDLASSHPVSDLMHCHDGTSLSGGVPAGFMDLDSMDVLPGVTGEVDEDDDLLDTFAYCPAPDVTGEETAAVSNTGFAGYSSNISSGESSVFGGGHDTEVVSPCAVPRTTTTAPPSNGRLGGYTAIPVSTTEAATGRRGAKRAAATLSPRPTSITFAGQSHHQTAAAEEAPPGGGYEPDAEATTQVKEMLYRAAAMRPVHQLVCGAGGGAPSKDRPRRKNVRISSDPQTVAARLRRERVSERLRVLQSLVPGGSRMDTASMLDEAASYLKFLKSQLRALESGRSPSNGGYHHSLGLLQNYAGDIGGRRGAGASTVLAFGRGAIGGYYVTSNSWNVQLQSNMYV